MIAATINIFHLLPIWLMLQIIFRYCYDNNIGYLEISYGKHDY